MASAARQTPVERNACGTEKFGSVFCYLVSREKREEVGDMPVSRLGLVKVLAPFHYLRVLSYAYGRELCCSRTQFFGKIGIAAENVTRLSRGAEEHAKYLAVH